MDARVENDDGMFSVVNPTTPRHIMSSSQIILVSMGAPEKIRVSIPDSMVSSLKTVQEMLDDIELVGEGPSVIRVPHVEDQKAFDLLIEYMEYDKDNRIEEDLKTGQKVPMSPWETEFFSELESLDKQPYLFQLISISNYLNYNRLFHTSCQKVANMIEGKTPEQIRKTFNLPDDLTVEEKEKLYAENGLHPSPGELSVGE